jgi:hypothetical protein
MLRPISAGLIVYVYRNSHYSAAAPLLGQIVRCALLLTALRTLAPADGHPQAPIWPPNFSLDIN